VDGREEPPPGRVGRGRGVQAPDGHVERAPLVLKQLLRFEISVI
jgi:hypothetical protein